MATVRGVLGLCIAWFACAASHASDIVLRLVDPPATGSLVIALYDSANAFGDFRNPTRQERVPVAPDSDYRLVDVEPGTVAVMVYADLNDNGTLDQNFIGLPTEPIWLSNDYRPAGPPSFERAAVDVPAGQNLELDVALIDVLGGGQWGVGIGVITRGSPYVDSTDSLVQPIPVITYFGERLQWVGPNIQYGLWGGGRVRVAAVANYRVGAYEEDDSPVLAGMGDRDGTLMAGLGVNADLPAGFELGVEYRHDVLDRIGGGVARIAASKAFQFGVVRLSPTVGVNWVSGATGDYEYGVDSSVANALRPAYRVGSSISTDIGINALIELSERWRGVVSVSAESLPDEITDSPIVDEDRLITGFAAIAYIF
ncbi:MAG: MipA/OmpV family protein [Gammaproteobacteria bacterium]